MDTSPTKDDFELEVLLGVFTYDGLSKFKTELQALYKSIEKVRETAQEIGVLRDAITHEKELIILNRNISLVGIALSIKESELCQIGTFENMWMN